jgi:3-mercaptopropionate dioxygenase
MSLTSTDSAKAGNAATATLEGRCPDNLVRLVRAVVRLGLDWQATAEHVVGTLRDNLPAPEALLPEHLRHGEPACYQSHLLYAEPDGSFSIAAMVWLPGQQTVIHDHVAWCVTAVLQGHEYEEIFALADCGRTLELVARNVNQAGTVSGFAPPGDIHRVRNTGDSVAISMHVYGADISRLGTSIRREYALPIR